MPRVSTPFSPCPSAHTRSVCITKDSRTLKKQIVIDANSAVRADATLQVGAVQQQVSVSSSTGVQVETTNTQMAEVITGSSMTIQSGSSRSTRQLQSMLLAWLWNRKLGLGAHEERTDHGS